MSHENTLPQTYAHPVEAHEVTPERWHWIFAALILAGMILIGVAVLMLLRESAPALASHACALAAELWAAVIFPKRRVDSRGAGRRWRAG